MPECATVASRGRHCDSDARERRESVSSFRPWRRPMDSCSQRTERDRSGCPWPRVPSLLASGGVAGGGSDHPERRRGLGVARARAASFLLPMLGSLLGYKWAREHLARRDDDVPRHGHAVLAGEGRGGDEGGSVSIVAVVAILGPSRPEIGPGREGRRSASGGRRGEVLGLTWERVDRARGVLLDSTRIRSRKILYANSSEFETFPTALCHFRRSLCCYGTRSAGRGCVLLR